MSISSIGLVFSEGKRKKKSSKLFSVVFPLYVLTEISDFAFYRSRFSFVDV